ncbi:hypothetical protein Cob_v008068 [Colletotrichum orbiculare MAFF 240422]|uniref:Uncharacterized protein n=1 Tax=Colletotrichum orbiculare (strain 104-T / ATCC 96160 / CBS 514.97 / LARS 414 / MAFF 240422) TaxID=1213857 RepID=A0A484FKV3_COLOR|nr:hypothetical protein Cob_v008068 [Colletotrichum orbiculare MAFF 240422]
MGSRGRAKDSQMCKCFVGVKMVSIFYGTKEDGDGVAPTLIATSIPKADLHFESSADNSISLQRSLFPFGSPG